MAKDRIGFVGVGLMGHSMAKNVVEKGWLLTVLAHRQREAVVEGPDGLASAGTPLVVVDRSASEPASTTRLAAALAPRGVTVIDAPLSRTPKGAWAGTLDVRVGGDEETEVFDAVIRGGRMHCPFYDTFFQYVLDGDRDAHRFTMANALKDLTYLAGFAQAAAIANPVGAAVRDSFAAAVASGRGADHVPLLSDVVAEANGLPPRA